VRDLVTGAETCPANTAPNAPPGYAEDAAFSPDGRQIAYVWALFTERRAELRVAPVAGGTPRRIPLSQTNNDYAPPLGWTPDGKQLLVLRSLPDRTGQLAFVNVSDGAIRPLKSFASWQDVNASLSPDGRMIAYDFAPDPKTQARDIFLLAADGSREIPAVQNPANDTNPMWSPDGSRILFLSNRTGQRALWSVPLTNGKPVQAELIKSDLPSGGRVWLRVQYLQCGAGCGREGFQATSARSREIPGRK
jgi:Tol biopolymer transport system component